MIHTFKPAYFSQNSTNQNIIFSQTSTIQKHLKDSWNIHNPNTYVLINTIVHLDYELYTCYPTKVYRLCGNWHKTLECLQN